MDPIETVLDATAEDLENRDILGTLLSEIGRGITPENLSAEALHYAEALSVDPSLVDPEELVFFLQELAARIQDIEDEIVAAVRSALTGLVYETLHDIIYESGIVYEHLSMIAENEHHLRVEMLKDGDVMDSILDPDGYCVYCGVNYNERREQDADVVNMALEASKAKRQLRELELQLAEIEVVARGRLNERIPRAKRTRRVRDSRRRQR